MDPWVRCHGMKANPTGYLWSKYECFLMSGCQDMDLSKTLKWRDGNGNANGNGNVNANANADAKVTTIALPVLCTGELKMECSFSFVFMLLCMTYVSRGIALSM